MNKNYQSDLYLKRRRLRSDLNNRELANQKHEEISVQRSRKRNVDCIQLNMNFSNTKTSNPKKSSEKTKPHKEIAQNDLLKYCDGYKIFSKQNFGFANPTNHPVARCVSLKNAQNSFFSMEKFVVLKSVEVELNF
ncbi:hypothetical protein M0813_01391 [Anaeramoeba flamelloides]|uniref:Uncharacterized protein n=1 Tax=Anaeramoeba flamelloides TaxID=1746091 RepID=A0ABQ8Z9G2_9EUKA|nr:hypothetical protein M0813_01391 [Anaeramoeba flamelloides]